MAEETQGLQITDEDRRKARVFFEQAQKVGGAGQYDYAITMYLDGLLLDPENIEAHQKLRDLSLRRKASGGKKMGMFEKMKFTGKSKDDRQGMINAERLLSLDDPGSLDYMDSFMQASLKAGCEQACLWMIPIYQRAMADSNKQEMGRLRRVRDHLTSLRKMTDAVNVSTLMLRLEPDNADLRNEHKQLSALEAIDVGKYEQKGSFTKSVRNLEQQQKLIEDEKDVVNEDFLLKQVRDLEAQVAADPKEVGKMGRLVEAMLKIDKPEWTEKALERLDEFYTATGQFRFRQKMFELKLRALLLEDRRMAGDLAKTPQDADKKHAYEQFSEARAQEELEIYREVSEQYPTEMKFRYEMADRLVKLGQYPEAIPIYQQAVNDPKLRTPATLKLGQAFLHAEFVDEAVDTLRGLQESYQIRGDDTAKEVFYWYARANEAKNDLPVASKAYSQVAQWDFNYRDVQTRIKAIRAKM